MISKATEDNLLEQLVLTQKSYIKQYFAASSWYDEFRRDLRFCEAIFFVGYSLQDPHITALIPSDESIKRKTFFITRGMPDKLFAEDLADYGEIHAIETSGFVRLCRNFELPDAVNDLNALKILKKVDVFKDNKAVMPPTSNEVFDLIAFGKFNERRCLSSLPEPNYIIPRMDIVTGVERALMKHRTILLHSRLGNGKSIIMTSIAHHLTKVGYQCFRCIDDATNIEVEINAVKNIEKIIFLFDSYDIAVSCIDRFVQIIPSAKFIVSIRTGIQQVRIHEIVDKLPQSIARIDANSFSAHDKAQLISLLEKTGVVKENIGNRIRNSSDIRDTVTAIYDNSYVKSRIIAALNPILSKKKLRGTMGVSLILTWIGQPAGASMFVDILDVDPVQIFSKYKEEISDILDIEGDSISAKSPIFAEYLIQTQFDIDDILVLIQRILVIAVIKKVERRYRSILSTLMSFSQLSRLLHKHPNHKDKIRELYNELQRDIDVREEPLFWLQYMISKIDEGRLDIAEGFMISAYDKARNSAAFETYQLDTQSLRLNLLIETRTACGQPIGRFEKIIKDLSNVSAMLAEENHRQFAIRVLEYIKPFIEKRKTDMSTDELRKLADKINEASIGLGSLMPGVRAEFGADIVKANLDLCQIMLMKNV